MQDLFSLLTIWIVPKHFLFFSLNLANKFDNAFGPQEFIWDKSYPCSLNFVKTGSSSEKLLVLVQLFVKNDNARISAKIFLFIRRDKLKVYKNNSIIIQLQILVLLQCLLLN